jgi:hypothetical protein
MALTDIAKCVSFSYLLNDSSKSSSCNRGMRRHILRKCNSGMMKLK